MGLGFKPFWRASIVAVGIFTLSSTSHAASLVQELDSLVKDRVAFAEATNLSPNTDELIYQGIQGYLNLVLQYRLVGIAEDHVAGLEELSKQHQDTEADQLLIQSYLSHANEGLLAYQSSLEEGQLHYEKLFFNIPNEDDLNDPLAPVELLPESLEQAIFQARKHNTNASQDQAAQSIGEIFAGVETQQRHFHTLVDAEHIAQAAYDTHYQNVQKGEEDLSELLQMAQDLQKVRTAVTSSDYLHRLASFKLLIETGQLTPTNLAHLITEAPLTGTPTLPIDDTFQNVAYNDLAAFEAAHGAPFSAELAPEPAPVKTVQESNAPNSYYLVLGSFSSPASAQRQIAQTDLNHAFIKPVTVNGRTVQRVLLGPLDQESARAEKEKVAGRGITDSWITRE
ncbi:SPOR domain-containing protein [Terasakiella pusilla]|uniref:SPOR domain-containing protein n=1 Tax=Terasakiella pusilla TaxID=64973 RepID=UPI003AA93B8B